jgi:hypothetical protein
MNVARQLIQLSGESDDHHDDNNNNSCAEGKVGDATDVSSTNYTIGETFEEEEEDGICWPRKRRFRSIYHLYRLHQASFTQRASTPNEQKHTKATTLPSS